MNEQRRATIWDGRNDGPRERLLEHGEEPLSDAELVALVLGTGQGADGVRKLASALLGHFGGLRQMARATTQELRNVRGVGLAKAARLKASIEIARRLVRANTGERPRFSSSSMVFDFIHLDLRDLRHEVFEVLLLDTRHRLLRRHRVSVGTLNGSLVHPREVFRPAIIEGAAAIVLVHNHPSGDPAPSREDVDITTRLIDAGKLIGIQVLDHVIVGDGRYVSLADRSAAPDPSEPTVPSFKESFF